MPTDPLIVACLPMQAGADPSDNAAVIRAAIDRAAEAGARILLTPEGALSGYPPATRPNWNGLDLCALADHEDGCHTHAHTRGLALVLGTVGRHPISGPGPTCARDRAATDAAGAPLPALANEALACGAIDGGTTRYRKRCLTPSDHHHFQAGGEAVITTVDGWRLGLSICFDLRFTDCFADYAAAGADAVLHIAHMAGPDPHPGTKQAVIPAFGSVRAAEWALPLISCNTAAEDRWIGNAGWDARGMAIAPAHHDGLDCFTLEPGGPPGDWYRFLRNTSLQRWKECQHG